MIIKGRNNTFIKMFLKINKKNNNSRKKIWKSLKLFSYSKIIIKKVVFKIKSLISIFKVVINLINTYMFSLKDDEKMLHKHNPLAFFLNRDFILNKSTTVYFLFNKHSKSLNDILSKFTDAENKIIFDEEDLIYKLVGVQIELNYVNFVDKLIYHFKNEKIKMCGLIINTKTSPVTFNYSIDISVDIRGLSKDMRDIINSFIIKNSKKFEVNKKFVFVCFEERLHFDPKQTNS